MPLRREMCRGRRTARDEQGAGRETRIRPLPAGPSGADRASRRRRVRWRSTSTESPLRWLASRTGRGRPALPVTASEVEAGERFRRDFTLAGLSPRLGAAWAAPVSGGRPAGAGPDYADVVLAARQRLDRTMAAVGPDFASLLLDVCGFLTGLEEAERERALAAARGQGGR
jgi:hypothetical protein